MLNKRVDKFTFFKVCKKCGVRYNPNGKKFSKYCDKCRRKSFLNGVNKRKETVKNQKLNKLRLNMEYF